MTLGHIRGIPIRAHFSLLLIVPYLAYLMSAQFRIVAEQAGVDPRAMSLSPVVWGLLLSVALFVCVLLHELGHSVVAMSAGGRVSAITLMLLGGVSELHGLPKTPKAEGTVAVAGPLVSFAIGFAALGLWMYAGGPPDLRFGLYYLGQINVVLGIFNLLPAFPMDGGRVLRAVLSTRLSRVSATRWAARTGFVFAALFVVLGLLSGNLLLALIGLFVWAGASAERQAVEREDAFEGMVVEDVMSPVTTLVESWMPVSVAASRMAAERVTAIPVVDDGRLMGVVAAHHVEALSIAARETTPVRAVVDPEVPKLHAQEPLSTALERMAERRAAEAPVLSGGELVGVLEAENLARYLRLRRMSKAAKQPQGPVPVPPRSPPKEPREPGLLHHDSLR